MIVHLALKSREQIHLSKKVILLERRCDYLEPLLKKEKEC
jgi:hypothetical protein